MGSNFTIATKRRRGIRRSSGHSNLRTTGGARAQGASIRPCLGTSFSVNESTGRFINFLSFLPHTLLNTASLLPHSASQHSVYHVRISRYMLPDE